MWRCSGDEQTRHHVRMPDHVPDRLVPLDEEYANILALFDRTAAVRRIVAQVPKITGVEIAWVGDPDGADQIVLSHGVNTATDVLEGLVVPRGVGLGGRVITARRPLWVNDYLGAGHISGRFRDEAEAEGVRAMIAVPIVHGRELLGVLYGANRSVTEFGDRTAAQLERIAERIAASQVVAERARHAAEVAVHEERRRLALDLHDTVGAMLYTLGAGIHTLGLEPGLDDAVRARLTVIEQQAAEASAVLRGSLRVLNAPPEQVALGVALREHCRAFTERTSIEARVIALTDLPTLPGVRIRLLADAAREALLNVEKHARAHSVVISVFVLRDGVAVTVSDDGVGIDPDEIAHGGLGLTAMSDRLARVGGTVTIGRSDEGGAMLQVWVPA